MLSSFFIFHFVSFHCQFESHCLTMKTTANAICDGYVENVTEPPTLFLARRPKMSSTKRKWKTFLFPQTTEIWWIPKRNVVVIGEMSKLTMMTPWHWLAVQFSTLPYKILSPNDIFCVFIGCSCFATTFIVAQERNWCSLIFNILSFIAGNDFSLFFFSFTFTLLPYGNRWHKSVEFKSIYFVACESFPQ